MRDIRKLVTISVAAVVLGPIVACSGGLAPDPNSSSSSSSGSSSGSSGSSGTTSGSSGTTSGSSGTTSSGGGGRVPEKHRAVATACTGERTNPEPTGATGGECAKHADCTQGRNGRCLFGRGGPMCTYDQCVNDGECQTGVCSCDSGTGGTDVCLHMSGCKIDADCGAGGFCSPSQGDCGNYSGVVGYFCHQANDECVDDKDCDGPGNPAGGVGNGSCRYNKMVGHWRCETSQCAG